MSEASFPFFAFGIVVVCQHSSYRFKESAFVSTMYFASLVLSYVLLAVFD